MLFRSIDANRRHQIEGSLREGKCPRARLVTDVDSFAGACHFLGQVASGYGTERTLAEMKQFALAAAQVQPGSGGRLDMAFGEVLLQQYPLSRVEEV